MEPSIKKNDQLVRFQVEMKKSYLDELRELQELGGATSSKELLNSAIALLRWAVHQKQQGYAITATTADGIIKREVVLPFLEEAAKHQAVPLRLISTQEDSQEKENPPVDVKRKPRTHRKTG